MGGIKSFFDSLNTHHVFGVGMGTGFLSIGVLAGVPHVEKATTHIPVLSDFVQAYGDVAMATAKAALPAALFAAGFGKPLNVPSPPK